MAPLVFRQEVRPFTDKQIELLTICGTGSHFNRKYPAAQRASGVPSQRTTADVLKVISRSTFDFQTVLRTLVELAARLCEADKATITRQKDGVFFRAEFYGFPLDFVEYVRDVPVEPEPGLPLDGPCWKAGSSYRGCAG